MSTNKHFLILLTACMVYISPLYPQLYNRDQLFISSGELMYVNDTLQNSSVIINKGVLNAAGVFRNDSAINGTGKVVLSGTSLQAVLGRGFISNLEINTANTAGASIIPGNMQSITGTLTLTAGTLFANGGLTLKSNETATAMVAPVTGGSEAGNVIVERYIPARRAWRLLSAPVAGSQSVNSAWQEGATTASANPDPYLGYGTHITGGSIANGFDQNPDPKKNHYSIKRYQNSTNSWISVGNTNTYKVNNYAYMLYVRGSRGIKPGDKAIPPDNTVLRAAGPLKTGDQTFTVNEKGFTAIPNPYASPINFATITKNNVRNSFYVWDPKMGRAGAFVNVSFNGTGYDITPASASAESQFIQSGQGFLVHSSCKKAGCLTIKETDKNVHTAEVFRSIDNSAGLRINLQAVNEDSTTSICDEVFSSYSRGLSGNEDDMNALKIPNVEENLAIIRTGEELMVDRKGWIVTADTIPLRLWNATTDKKYFFEFNPVNLASPDLSAVLIDNYIHTVTPLSLMETSKFSFNPEKQAVEAASDRFMVILTSGKPTGIVDGKSTIACYPNPVSGKVINLQFANQPAGIYNIELVNSLGQALYKGQMKHAGGSATLKLQLAEKPAGGLYQVKVSKGILNRVIPVVIK